MRSRDVVGRKIVGVIQHRCHRLDGTPFYDVVALVLDNGAHVDLTPVELEGDMGIEGQVSR